MRGLAVLCVLLALTAGMSGLALGLYGEIQSAQNAQALRQLLLDGKTASAISAKQTAGEVKLLVAQQKFDHAQQVNGQRELTMVVRNVEAHLDRTIRLAVEQAASQVARRYGARP